jgi:hypothetical protein
VRLSTYFHRWRGSGCGGKHSRTVECVHEKFWLVLLTLTGEMRERHKERWRKLGGKIGVKEWEYKVDLPVEDVGEEGEGMIMTTVAIAAQA